MTSAPSKLDIHIKAVSAGYSPGHDVIHQVDVQVAAGSLTVIIGPNGAGKTTLLNAAAGFLPKRSGEVKVGDSDLTSVRPFELVNYRVGYIPQSSTLFPDFTVHDNLIMAGKGVDGGRHLGLINEVYEQFSVLKEKSRTKAGNLSGGQQKILEVGKVIMQDPKVLLVDEPTTGIQPNVVVEIYNTLKAFSKRGTTILLVDQNVRQAVEIADYVYVLNLGRITNKGKKEVFAENLSEIIRGWFRS